MSRIKGNAGTIAFPRSQLKQRRFGATNSQCGCIGQEWLFRRPACAVNNGTAPGSSLTDRPTMTSLPARTVSSVCARSSGFSASAPKSAGSTAMPVHRCTTTSWNATPCHRAQPAVADRSGLTVHRRGQALPVREQGRPLEPERRVLHGLADEGLFGGHRPAPRGGPPRIGVWMRDSFGEG